MAKVYAPNKKYAGVSATVAFVNGVGETDNADLLAWFERNGYTVEQEAAENKPSDLPSNDSNRELKDRHIEDLIAYAADKNIDLGQATTHAGILKKIQEAERAE